MIKSYNFDSKRMDMNKKQIIESLFGFTEATFYRWKAQKRPIINLVSLFSDKELEKFLLDGSKQISKFELIENQEVIFRYSRNKYLSIFISPLGSLGDTINKDFMDFYFNVLVFAKEKIQDQTIFEPFDIQRSSLLYSTKNNFTYEASESEIIPKFEVGLERLGQFDCYTNQFLYSNLMQEFKPMIQLDLEHLDLDQKVEAYLHTILFKLYHVHRNKNTEEKRELLVEIIETLYISSQKNIQEKELQSSPIFNLSADDISLDQLLKKDFKLIQKEFDKIIQAVEVV
jgi:hypothetical protein